MNIVHDAPSGEGMDRTLIRMMLTMTPTQRIASLAQEARFINEIHQAGEAERRPGTERVPSSSPA